MSSRQGPRPEPEYVVQHAYSNRADRRKAARQLGGETTFPGWNKPYRRPFWEKPGRHLARLAELEDAGQLRGRAVIELDAAPAPLAP